MSFSQDYAWAAGFLDGDGCIRVAVGCPDPTKGSLSLVTSGCHPYPHNKFLQIFGGSTAEPRVSASSIGNRPVFRWAAYGPTAYSALQNMLPYLTEKYEQAMMALNWCDTDCPQERKVLHRMIKRDKRKGHKWTDTY